MDFAYEEWATSYRTSLHAAYLRVIEHAIRLDIDAGHFGRGTYLAERAADVEPESEEIQVALVNLGHPGQLVEVFDHAAFRVMDDLAIFPVANAGKLRERDAA